MKNKAIWIGVFVGLIIGLIVLLNLNNCFGRILLLPFLFIYRILAGPCIGNACDDKLGVFIPFIKFIPIVFAICGGLIGLIIQKIRKRK